MRPCHVVVPYPATNSSVRVRALEWIHRAVAAGRRPGDSIVLHGPGWPRAPIPKSDDVLLLRNMRRLTRGGVEARVLSDAGLGVYDLDDGLPWDDGDLPGLGHWTKRPFPRSTLARRAASAADRVIVGNQVLADWATGYCPDVRLIPTCVAPDDYRVKTSWELSDPPVIGWIGSPATETYLAEIAPALAEVHRRTGAVLHMISGPGAVDPRLERFTRKTIWHVDSVRTLADWDVGVMPLRDGVYERAKCGYKLLQYAAAGVPAVGSPVGVNRQLLGEMGGLSPTDTASWVDALVDVLDRPAAARREQAELGLAVARRYSYEAWQDAWLDAVGW